MVAAPLIAALRRRVAETRNADGGWGYLAGRASRAEPTLWAAAATGQGLTWLAAHPLEWCGLLAPALLWDQAPGQRAGWLRAIEALRGRPVDGVEDFDATLPGWAWVDGTASWVVPTAMAGLSLLRAGDGRAAEAVALVANRRCEDGGWNYGNPRAFGASLPAQPQPTAWCTTLLAAAGHPAPLDLEGAFSSQALGPSSLGLLLLAAARCGQDTAPWVQRLEAALGSMAGPPRLDHTALAALALARAAGGPCPLTGQP